MAHCKHLRHDVGGAFRPGVPSGVERICGDLVVAEKGVHRWSETRAEV